MLNGTSVTSVSQVCVCASAILLLLIVGNQELQCCGAFFHNVNNAVHNIWSVGLKFEIVGQTDGMVILQAYFSLTDGKWANKTVLFERSRKTLVYQKFYTECLENAIRLYQYIHHTL